MTTWNLSEICTCGKAEQPCKRHIYEKKMANSEKTIQSVIGEDTECKVYFDYHPPFHGSRTDPPHHAEVIINSVMVKNGDFLDDLSKSALERLEQECFESMSK